MSSLGFAANFIGMGEQVFKIRPEANHSFIPFDVGQKYGLHSSVSLNLFEQRVKIIADEDDKGLGVIKLMLEFALSRGCGARRQVCSGEVVKFPLVQPFPGSWKAMLSGCFSAARDNSPE